MIGPGTHLPLTQLATFREFGRLGTLAAAAASLGYTPGAVSQHVAALERTLGVPLVQKAGRRRVLTDAGQVLLGHADAILAAERDALRAVTSLHERVAGPLTVGTWGSTAAALLAPVVERMSAEAPEVVVRSKEVDLDAAATAVRHGQVDVAFGLDYADAPLPRDRGISVVELHEEDFDIAVAAAGREGQPIDVDELAGLPWILAPAASSYGSAIRAGFRRRGFEPAVSHEVTDTAASLQLAAAGLGATVMTPWMRRLSPELALDARVMRDPLSRRVVLLASSEHRSRAVTAFTTAVAEVAAALAASG
jgi:DNA-binding transcriptional LysR family regulator